MSQTLGRRSGGIGLFVPLLPKRNSSVTTGRRMNRSAIKAVSIARALSQPKRRSVGRFENTVIASPQARTTDSNNWLSESSTDAVFAL